MPMQLKARGNVGQTPSMKNVPVKDETRPVAEFTVFAQNSFQRNGDGDVKDENGMWLRCSVWGERRVQDVMRLIKKGFPIVVEGQLTVNPYFDSEGKPQTSYDLTVDNWYFPSSMMAGFEKLQREGSHDAIPSSTPPAPAAAQF